MLFYTFRRMAHAAVVLVLVVLVASLLLRLIPGDPVDVISAGNPGITEEDKDIMREQLGLDGPAHSQVWHYVQGLAKGDLGTSLQFRLPVSEIVGERLPATIELAVAGLAVAVLIAIPAGIYSAVRQGSIADHAASTLVLIGFSIPSFLVGVLLIYLFSTTLHVLPSSGLPTSLFPALLDGDWAGAGDALRHLALPAFALGLSLAAWSTRMIRQSMIAALSEDYVKFARAKGLSTWSVVIRHGFKNALIPVMTLLGLQMGYLLSGAFIIENVFAWPGLGRSTVQAILFRDYPVVQGVVLVTAVTFLVFNLLIDLLYAALDPRIRLA